MSCQCVECLIDNPGVKCIWLVFSAGADALLQGQRNWLVRPSQNAPNQGAIGVVGAFAHQVARLLG